MWSAADPLRARELIERAGAVGQEVTVWVGSFDIPGAPDVMGYVTEVLNELGLHAELKVVDRVEEYYPAILGGEAPIFMLGWVAGFPGAGDFIPPQFTCGAFANASGYCEPRVDAAIAAAQGLQSTDPAAANAAWTAIEHGLIEDAVWAPLVNPVSPSVFSARTQNIQDHPQWGILLSRLWVQ